MRFHVGIERGVLVGRQHRHQFFAGLAHPFPSCTRLVSGRGGGDRRHLLLLVCRQLQVTVDFGGNARFAHRIHLLYQSGKRFFLSCGQYGFDAAGRRFVHTAHFCHHRCRVGTVVRIASGSTEARHTIPSLLARVFLNLGYLRCLGGAEFQFGRQQRNGDIDDRDRTRASEARSSGTTKAWSALTRSTAWRTAAGRSIPRSLSICI